MKLEMVDDCCARARELIAEGCDSEEKLEFYRGEVLCLSGRARTFARLTLKENAKSGPVHVRWRPFPDMRQRSPIDLNVGGRHG